MQEPEEVRLDIIEFGFCSVCERDAPIAITLGEDNVKLCLMCANDLSKKILESINVIMLSEGEESQND